MAKKKKKRSRAQPAEDPNARRRERLDARRRQRAEQMAAQRRAERRERMVRYALIAGLGAAVFWFFFMRGALPNEIRGHAIQSFSTRGANQHVDDPVQYESSPPVSGAHATNPAPCGTHATTIPNENFVHTLEHGAVGIVYQPTLDAKDIARIEKIVAEFDSHVVSMPSADIDTPIAVAAWAHLMKLDELDETAIREFIEVFRQGGAAPEANQDCPNSQDASFSPEPTGSPSPSPSPSPDGAGDKKRDRNDEGG